MFIYPENFLYRSAAEFVCNHGLTQLVDTPTRGNNILDLVLCSDVLCCDSVCLLPPIGTSDHAVVSMSLCVSFVALMVTKQDLTMPRQIGLVYAAFCRPSTGQMCSVVALPLKSIGTLLLVS